jgi:hypothetical protein
MERSNGDESQIPIPNHPKLPTQLPKQHLQKPRAPTPLGAARCGISANTWRARTAAQQHHALVNREKRRGVPGSPRRRQLGGSAQAAEQRRLEDARCQHGRGRVLGGGEYRSSIGESETSWGCLMFEKKEKIMRRNGNSMGGLWGCRVRPTSGPSKEALSSCDPRKGV